MKKLWSLKFLKVLFLEKRSNKSNDRGWYRKTKPVILTAITTVLGLIPLAIGLNIDFSLYSQT